MLAQLVRFDGFDPLGALGPYEVLFAGGLLTDSDLTVELVTAEGPREVPSGTPPLSVRATAQLSPERADLILDPGVHLLERFYGPGWREPPRSSSGTTATVRSGAPTAGFPPSSDGIRRGSPPGTRTSGTPVAVPGRGPSRPARPATGGVPGARGAEDRPPHPPRWREPLIP
ncbi:hypothetical protein ACIODT_23785 [Streptomyces sp. NPDC088251]|uniref:hypothetical protein n=1 Tax=Streptomyces sp. NPDC088251 TaxID=3365844 RepID=UPI0037FD639E